MLDNTDSYCERCGTRYPFRANATKTLSLKGARVLAKGLKNFVLTDGQSLNDSLALAREANEHENTTRMTEAFHSTFNFCMTCRQYACDKCWNPHQGACLTCAPEPGLGPVEPEDHLIVRTPVARGDSDWALFRNVFESEPPAEASPPMSAWPVQDLRISPREGGSGSAESHDQLVRQSEDREAWSVWPITDEIAPEMTLTPAEMVIIEAQLAQDEPAESAAADHEAAPSAALADLPEAEAWVPSSAIADEPAEPVESLSLMEGDQPDLAASPESAQLKEQGVPVVFADMTPPPSPAPVEEQGVPVVFADMTPPPSPAPAEEQASAITRLLGRFSLRGDSSVRSPAPATRADEPAGEPWPHATEWSQRPIQDHDWFADASPLPEPEIAQVDAAYAATPLAPQLPDLEIELAAQAAEPSDEVPSAPEPLADAVRSVDFAEPLRMAAIPPPPPVPSHEPVPVSAGQQTLFDVAPATDDIAGEHGMETAARPDAHPEVAEVLPEPAPPLAAASPTVPLEAPPLYRAPQAPAAWPPIGASWPARETPGAPWPGPEAPSVPAAVAAREAALPVLAGMWAQSAQEVLNHGSVRVCHHCALPVSTQARFCRRCGTKQA
jgi:ribosomal protein L40E